MAYCKLVTGSGEFTKGAIEVLLPLKSLVSFVSVGELFSSATVLKQFLSLLKLKAVVRKLLRRSS